VTVGVDGLLRSLFTMHRQAAAKRRAHPAGAPVPVPVLPAHLPAHLHVGLRRASLVVTNLGPGEARKITIDAGADTGRYDRLHRLDLLPAGTEQAIALPPGHDGPYLDVLVAWHDAVGHHQPEHRVAAL
jgi:hypothetical protein